MSAIISACALLARSFQCGHTEYHSDIGLPTEQLRDAAIQAKNEYDALRHDLSAERNAHAETRQQLLDEGVANINARIMLEAARAETARLRGLLESSQQSTVAVGQELLRLRVLLRKTYTELMKLEGWAPDCLCEEFNNESE